MHKHEDLPEAFATLGLSAAVLRGVKAAGFTEPTDIQRELIPVILARRDVIGQARTGTGKTAAFGLPILQFLDPTRGFQALVMTPTRELAVQVAGEIRRLAEFTGLHCIPIYGGQKIAHQVHLLGRKPHIIVGTPGRVLDMLGRRHLSFDQVRVVVLDEVDRMLDIGFRDDIRRILGQVAHAHQTIFVSATITEEINRLVRQFTEQPVQIDVSRDELTVAEVRQAYLSVQPWDKFAMLLRLLRRENLTLAIVFTNTKHGARKLAKRLHHAGIDAKEIHGDLVQERRERVMDRFRRHKIRILVATDLAARGIDVHAISHIINYDFPKDPEVYVHRIGRTARMGAFGAAYSLVTGEEGRQLTEVEKLINKQIVEERMEGFVPRAAPEPSAETRPSPPRSVPRHLQPVFAGSPPGEVPAAAKTLGAKFRPARRRRR